MLHQPDSEVKYLKDVAICPGTELCRRRFIVQFHIFFAAVIPLQATATNISHSRRQDLLAKHIYKLSI